MKRGRGISCLLCAGLMVTLLGGCGSGGKKNEKPSINIEPYIPMTYETTTVQSGDIAPILELRLKPDEYETKNYSVEQNDLEIERINVEKGDKVKAGDIMVAFKAEDIQETIDSYTEQKAESEMLIDHYKRLMEIDPSLDYSADIAGLREDIEIANLYIEEQNEKLKDYCIIAERDGTVTFVNEYLQYGWAPSGNTLVTVVSGSSNYTVTTDDDFAFQVGEIYQADFEIATYGMRLASIEDYVDDATGKTMHTLLFEPTMDMTGVSQTDTLDMVIHKPVISNVIYVDERAVIESTDGKDYVYLLSEDGYRTAVFVTVGDTIDGCTIIEEGLTAGEQVTIG